MKRIKIQVNNGVETAIPLFSSVAYVTTGTSLLRHSYKNCYHTTQVYTFVIHEKNCESEINIQARQKGTFF